MIMWGNIVINNVEVISSFKRGLLLISLLEFLFLQTNQIDWMGFFY